MNSKDLTPGMYFTFDHKTAYLCVYAGLVASTSERIEAINLSTNSLATHSGGLVVFPIEPRDALKMVEKENIKKFSVLFENHFNDNTTYIIGDWCLNGCQLFHKDQAHDVFKNFDVPESFQEDVMNSFGKEVVYFPTSSISINMLFAKQGIHLKELSTHRHWKVRKLVAEHQNNEINAEMLLTENNEDVLCVLKGMENK